MSVEDKLWKIILKGLIVVPIMILLSPFIYMYVGYKEEGSPFKVVKEWTDLIKRKISKVDENDD